MRRNVKVRLFHWKAAEAVSLIETLRAAGYRVDYEEKIHSGSFGELRRSLPDAFVIDLSRLPSQGREVATALRGRKATRDIPIVFVGGDGEKVEAIRQLLPDAVYAPTEKIRSALRHAIAHAPAAPAVPIQMMDRYAARTAARKLGIVGGSQVAVMNPPVDYEKVIGELPAGVSFEEDSRSACPVTLWFIRDPDELRSALPRIRNLAPRTRLWIVWPKQSAPARGAITQPFIRESATVAGLVDYKICSVDRTWSAMLFARKKQRYLSGGV